MKSTDPFSRLFKKEEVIELPFFVFLTGALILIAGISAFSSPQLKEPLRLVLFIVLMISHILLYWAAPVLVGKPGRSLPYIALQMLLALLINVLGQNLALIFGLYLSLIGISAGLFRNRRQLAAVVAVILLLSLANYGMVEGWNNLLGWALVITPMITFVILYVVVYSRQSEARARAQALAAELEEANRRLEDYSARVEDLTLANERQRMARELHDTLSQGLAGLILNLEAADAHLASNRAERARSILQQTLLQARATLADARSAIDNLRAARPGPEGLDEILRSEAAHFTESTGIACTLEVDPALSLPHEVTDTLRRIATEALTNIARHARAHSVEVRCHLAAGQLEASIRDDGVGFDPATLNQQTGHYGLLGMSERARLAGGKLEVHSQPGKGTTLTLVLPLETAQAQPLKDQ
jgi:NarL family two-component system sensor histidine kinase YdfH